MQEIKKLLQSETSVSVAQKNNVDVTESEETVRHKGPTGKPEYTGNETAQRDCAESSDSTNEPFK